MTIGEALEWAKTQLYQSLSTRDDSLLPYGYQDALVDARTLLCHVLQRPKSHLFTWPDAPLDETDLRGFRHLIEGRMTGTPVAHLVAHQGFWNLSLEVSPATLIPRPDTEALVETALNLPLSEDARVLDLGTGTGAIALALASERRQWRVVASEKSADAVALAARNRDKLGLHRVQVVKSDWFAHLSPQQFDLIISNPPYVETSSPFLAVGDVRYEPRGALTSGTDGLDDIRIIAAQSPQWLAAGGYLMLEHGYEQAIAVDKILGQVGFSDISTGQDFAGLDRFTLGKLR